jgi:hypothetical protein
VILAALLLAAMLDDAAALMRRASARLSVAGAPADDSRFRVAREETDELPPELKGRAVSDTGTRCGTGARLCTRPPRTLLRAPLIP